MAALLQRSYSEPDELSVRKDYVISYEGDSDEIHTGDKHAESAIAANLKIKAWHFVDELNAEIAQFETVFWEPNDTDSLRQWLVHDYQLEGKQILEVGTGTGLVSLLCAKQRAEHVIATDINPAAFANAKYNAQHLGLSGSLDLRLVSASDPGPFAPIDDSEFFDLIISNPPWEDLPVKEVAAHALYDPGFKLLDGLLKQSARHLNGGGKLLLAYGAKKAIRRILERAPNLGWQVYVADERDLDELPEVFLPGMLLVLNRT